MKHTRGLFIVGWVLSLVLVGTVTAEAGKPYAPAAEGTTAFTHQGQIKRNGALFTGTCDMLGQLHLNCGEGGQSEIMAHLQPGGAPCLRRSRVCLNTFHGLLIRGLIAPSNTCSSTFW